MNIKRGLSLLYCTFALTITVALAQPKTAWKLEITNPSAFNREDEQITITRKSILDFTGAIPSGKIPLVKDAGGNYIPSQTDDLDGDGQWDELALVTNLASKQRLQLSIDFVNVAEVPSFKPRTNVHLGKKLGSAPVQSLSHDMLYGDKLPRGEGYPYQTDGPSWENEYVAYRHYFDGRNCRDVFGKRMPVMVMDTVGIFPSGKVGDTYHQLKSWGRDIYSVSQGIGAGGLAMLDGDTLVRLGVLASQTVDNVDSTEFTIINRGPVRAIFKLNHYGWQVHKNKYNVHQIVTIWAGSHGYSNKVWLEGDTTNKFLLTGIVHNNDKNGLTVKNYVPNFTGLITHDQQTYNREYILGLALLLPTSQYAGNFDTPTQGPGILYTYCAKLKLPVKAPLTYYVYSGWELQDVKFRDASYFIGMITHEAAMRNMPATVKLKKK
jgi:hypothetical protein